MDGKIEEFKKELGDLVEFGQSLYHAMQYECYPEKFREKIIKQAGSEEKADKFINDFPSFSDQYQNWYTKSKAVISQVLPDRLDDFVSYYEPARNRKEIKFGNYTVYDYLQGLRVTSGIGEVKVDPSAALPQFRQQLNILKSAQERFQSKLFDIKQLTQADVFDTEIDGARELRKHKFLRSSGVIAGVVLEKHLAQVCESHSISFRKKKPTLSDFIQKLKESEVIDTPTMRRLQSLADVRNLCGHGKDREPTEDEVDELIAGVDKAIKTLF